MKREIRDRLRLIKESKRDTDKCIFCGVSPTTREHVFSEWTHKYMLPRKEEKAKTYMSIAYVDRVIGANLKLSGPIRDWQVKCVCVSCNTVWMSQLDTAAGRIMKPLILGRRARLTEKECRIVATWAVLKTMVVHSQIVHHAKRKKFKETQTPPENWGVWIANYRRRRWKGEWLSWPFGVRKDAELSPRRRMAYTHYATIQIIKKLFIHVVNCPYENFPTRFRFSRPDRSILSGDVILLWPYTGRSILWPPKPLSDDDAIVAATVAVRAFKRNDDAARKAALGMSGHSNASAP